MGRPRTCLFGCRKPRFGRESHSLPRFFGSKIVSLDECDICNEEFGRTIDNDLAEFLKPMLAMLTGRIVYKDNSARIQGRIPGDLDFVVDPSNGRLDGDGKRLIVSISRPEVRTAQICRAMAKYACSLWPRQHLAEIVTHGKVG